VFLSEKHINIMNKINEKINIFLAKFFNKILLKLIIFLCAVIIILSIIGMHNSFIHSLLGSFCHQNIERSFRFYSFYLGVCSRCFGIYLGLFLYGVYLLKYKKIDIGILFISLFATILSVILRHFGIDTDNFIRFILGIFNGVLLIIIFYKFEEFYSIIFQKSLTSIEKIL